MTTEATENSEGKGPLKVEKGGGQETIAEPTAQEKAQKASAELMLALQEEKIKAWQEIQAILDKGNFQFDVEMTMSGTKGVRYTLDLLKKAK